MVISWPPAVQPVLGETVACRGLEGWTSCETSPNSVGASKTGASATASRMAVTNHARMIQPSRRKQRDFGNTRGTNSKLDSIACIDIRDAGANGLDRAQRGKPVAKRPRLSLMANGVDAGGFEPPAFWLQTRRSSN